MNRQAGKRILLILPYGGVGGIERLVDTFYRTYVAQGQVVRVLKVIGLSDDIVNFGADESCLSDRDLSEMPVLGRLWFYLVAPFKLRSLIRRNRITHSIAFGDVANLYSAMTFTGEFKVASVHSLKSVELRSRTLLARATWLGYRSFYRFFDRVVSIGESIRKDLVDGCGYAFPDRLRVAYNPHDVAGIVARGKEDLPDADLDMFSRPVILFVGRLSSPKAPWRLVEAFRKLVADGADANLVFVGDGSPQVVERLERMIREAGLGARTFLVGRRENPYAYMARASVLALTSSYEGTPNVIVEAIALGIPVVSSNCSGGVAELMSRTGAVAVTPDRMQAVDAGFITPHYPEGMDGDAGQVAGRIFAAALERAITDPHVKGRLLEARNALLGKFGVDRAASEYLE